MGGLCGAWLCGERHRPSPHGPGPCWGLVEIGATGPHSLQKMRLVYFGNTILATVSLINCCGHENLCRIVGLFFDHPKPEAQIQGFVVGTRDLGDCHAKYLSARHYS